MPASHVLAVLENFREAHWSELLGDPLWRGPWIVVPDLKKPGHKHGTPRRVRGRHVDPKLKTPPYGAIQKLRMIGRRYGNDVAGQLIELHQQERDDPLDLTGFMDVAPFFSDGIELVEEQHAGRRACILE